MMIDDDDDCDDDCRVVRQWFAIADLSGLSYSIILMCEKCSLNHVFTHCLGSSYVKFSTVVVTVNLVYSWFVFFLKWFENPFQIIVGFKIWVCLCEVCNFFIVAS